MLCNFDAMKNLRFCLLFVLILFVGVDLLDAQCAMCKATLESNLQSGEEAKGQGINQGIMYIMFVPYILIGVVGYFMYKHYKKTQALEA